MVFSLRLSTVGFCFWVRNRQNERNQWFMRTTWQKILLANSSASAFSTSFPFQRQLGMFQSTSFFPSFLFTSHVYTSTSSARHRNKPSFTNIDDALYSFNRMFHMHPLPSLVQFNSLLSAIVRMKHYGTVVSVSKQMELYGIKHDVYTLNI